MANRGIAEFQIDFRVADPAQLPPFNHLYQLLQELKLQEFPLPGTPEPSEAEIEALGARIAAAIAGHPQSQDLEDIVARMEESEYILSDLAQDGDVHTLRFEVLGYPFGSYLPLLDLVTAFGFEVTRDTYDEEG